MIRLKIPASFREKNRRPVVYEAYVLFELKNGKRGDNMLCHAMSPSLVCRYVRPQGTWFLSHFGHK